MAEEKDGVVQVTGSDDPRASIMGQDTEAVKAAAQLFSSLAAKMGRSIGYPEVGSALLSATVNFLLTLYTVESVRDVLEGVLPNLQPMHDDLEAIWLMQMADKDNPQ